MKTALILLFAVTAAMAVQVGYVAPVSGGYIYRSDNNGPASIIQLGAVPYHEPHSFAPALPLAQPLQQIQTYDLAPVPLPYLAAKPIAIEDEEDDEDESDESDEEYLDGQDDTDIAYGPHHAAESGTGSEYGEEHHAAHGNKGSKGYNSQDHVVEGKSGHYGNEHKEGFYHEKEGEDISHNDEADASGQHYEKGHNYKGGDEGHKKHFSKGEDVTGYHKVFHKDEFKKDHDFYDVADKSGHFKKYAHGNEKHGLAKGAHQKGHNHDAAFDEENFEKALVHGKGHIDEIDEEHSAESGQDSNYSHEEDSASKGGKTHEKEYFYDDDDSE